MDPFPKHEPGETNQYNVAKADQEAHTEAVVQETTYPNQGLAWIVQEDDKKRALLADSHIKLCDTAGEPIACFSHWGCGIYEFIERKICENSFGTDWALDL